MQGFQGLWVPNQKNANCWSEMLNAIELTKTLDPGMKEPPHRGEVWQFFFISGHEYCPVNQEKWWLFDYVKHTISSILPISFIQNTKPTGSSVITLLKKTAEHCAVPAVQDSNPFQEVMPWTGDWHFEKAFSFLVKLRTESHPQMEEK